MKKIKKRVLFLLVSFVTTTIAITFLYFNNNTYPIKSEVVFNNKSYSLHFPIEHVGKHECLLEFPINDTTINGVLYYRDIKTDMNWKSQNMVHLNYKLNAILPSKPANSKVIYYVSFYNDEKSVVLFKNKMIRIVYKDKVPEYLHYTFYFICYFAIFFSTFTGFYAIFNFYALKKYSLITYWILLISGVILGSLNQLISIHFDLKAIPFSFDFMILKMFLIFLFWWAGYSIFKKYKKRWGIVLASSLSLILIFIPFGLFHK